MFMRLKISSLISTVVTSLSLFSVSSAQVSGGLGGVTPNSKSVTGAVSSAMNNIYSPNIFDGSANISIPIHQYSMGGQDYGVSLAYNTRGVKVDEVVSPAGLHWNIMAEGSIARVIKDLPDELNFEADQYIEWEDSSVLNKNRYLKGKLVTYTESLTQQQQPNVYRDKECDDFVFTCGGQSFTFNLGRDFKVFTHPHRNISVSTFIDGVPVFFIEGQTVGNWGSLNYSGVLEFVIRDESGNQYYFGLPDFQTMPIYKNEFEPNLSIGSIAATVKWVVKKVVLANGNVIKYNYSEEFQSLTLNGYKQYYSTETWSNNNPASAKFLGAQEVPLSLFSRQLQNIEYPNGSTVDFIYDANETTEMNTKMLREIKISDGSNVSNCFRYKFSQSKVNGRWFLDRIRLLSCDGSLEEPYYSFGYDPLALPPRLDPAQDFYGYYNATPTGTSLSGEMSSSSGTGITIPKHHITLGGSLSYMNYGGSRMVNGNNIKAGILTEVKNAYGGQVSFRYTTNTAFAPYPYQFFPNILLGENAMDGLCVDSIIEKDIFHPGSAQITKYEYLGGQIFIPGGCFHYPDYVDSLTGHWDRMIFQSTFLTSHHYINGANHGYSRVNEIRYAESGELLGRKQVIFSNLSDEYSNWKPNYRNIGKHFSEYPYTDKQYLQDWKIGLPMKIEEFDQNDRIVAMTENFYDTTFDNSASTYISNSRVQEVNSGKRYNAGYFMTEPYYPYKKLFVDNYYPYTGSSLLRSTKVRTYVSDTKYVEDSTLYAYDSRQNLNLIVTYNSKGEQINTVHAYNYDLGGLDVSPGAPLGSTLYNMTNGGLEKVVVTESWKNSPTIYGQKLLNSVINTFSFEGGILLPKAVYNLQAGEPVSYTDHTGMGMGSPIMNPYNKAIEAFSGITPGMFQKSTDVKLFDQKGNPLETQLGGIDRYKSMIWDTANGNKMAEVVNAQFGDIAFSGFETIGKGNLVYNNDNRVPSNNIPGGTISGQHALKIVNTQQDGLFHPGLTIGKTYIISFWCRGGTPTLGGAGLSSIPLTWVHAQDGWTYYSAEFIPQSTGQVGFVQTGSPSSPFTYYVDDVRIHPKGATMQSYNYIPIFGLSSSADEKGRLTYFEYDKLGRQVLVRDQQGNIISKTKHVNFGGN